MNYVETIEWANQQLPGDAAEDGAICPRWHAVIAVGEFVETEPELVWEFARSWGGSEDADLQVAIGTCILEHLLEHHFDAIFPRVEAEVLSQPQFSRTLANCWKLGQSIARENSPQFDALMSTCSVISAESE